MAGNILATMLLMIQAKSDTSGLNKTDNAIRRTTRTVRNARKEMSLLGTVSRNMQRMLLGGVGLFGAITAGNRYLQFEKDLGAMQTRFYAITHDMGKASEEFDWIRKRATDLSLDIKSTADSYSIFYSAVQKSMGQEGARQVFDNWTKVGRVLHLSEYQMKRVTYALREMASKGAIYSQDLRMQIGTHVPNAMGLAEEAAKEMGITGSNWFETLQEKAKGNAKLTAEFVRRFSAQAEKQFASPDALKKSLQQPDALAKSISNIGYNFMVDFSRAGGSYMIVKVLSGISKALTSIDYNKLTDSLGNIAKTIGNIFDYIPQIFDVLKLILQSVMILYGFKGIFAILRRMNVFWTTFKYFSKTTPFITKLLYSLGKAFPIMSKFATFMISKGLRGVLAGVLGATGPLGWLVGIVTFLPEIVSVIKWIANKMGMKDGKDGSASKDILDPQHLAIAKKMQQLIDTNSYYVANPEALKNRMLYYKGGKDMVNYTWVDNGKIIVQVNGQGLDTQQMAEQVADKVKREKGGVISQWFNKPKQAGVSYDK